MIRIGICDDEELIGNQLRKVVQECVEELEENVEFLTFSSGMQVADAADVIDLLFLDIEMPEMDGIETGKKLQELGSPCKIVMATSKVERYKDAFKINAFRFVTKPFQKEEVKEAIEAFCKSQLGMELIEVYKMRNAYQFQQKEIEYLAAVNSAVELHIGDEIFRKEISLNELEHILDQRLFYRVNRNCIVNMNKIEDTKQGMVICNGKKITVSIRRRKEFERSYLMYDVNYR